MKLRNLLLSAISMGALVFLGFSGTASAQMGPGMMGGYGGGYGYQSLSPEQQSTAQKLYADYYAKTNPLRQKLIAKQYELNALLYSDKGDEKKIQELTKEVSDLRAKIYESQVALQRQLSKANIPFMGGMYGSGMGYGGGMGSGMMGYGGGMGPGMMGY